MKCDELKVYVPQDGPYGLEPEEGGKLVEEETCYLKSKADEAIAELKNEIEKQKRLRDMALASVPNVLKVMKIIQHQKYKRCEAMAECRDAQARLFHRFGTEVMLKQLYGRNPAVDMKQMDRRSSRCRLASQLWKKRAEKFKDAK